MMRRIAWLPLAMVLAALAGGCSQEATGRMRDLGRVDPPELAFTTAKEVMAMYFDIASADPDTGTIKARPKMVQDQKERLLGASPTRQVASLQIVRSEWQVSAQVAVAIQQQGSGVYRTMKGPDSYDTVPHQTPAELDAGTTVEQNETWRTIGYSYDVERKILYDLYRRLHPEGKE